MKICVPLRDPATADLRADNFRSEPRWERLALEAVIRNPEVSEIYVTGCKWKGAKDVTSKYKGMVNATTAKDCVLLMQDWNLSIIGSLPFKAAVINIFHGPWLEQKEEIWKVTKSLKDNLFFTMCHPTIYIDELTYPELFDNKLLFPICKDDTDKFLNNKSWRNMDGFVDRVRKSPLSHMRNFTSMDRFFFLPAPWVPESHYEDRFNNTGLLWACRLISMWQLRDRPEINWALNKMLEDDSLYLDILTGFNPGEARIITPEGEAVPLKEEINGFFWNMEEFKPYEKLRGRVTLHYGVSWNKVLELNAKSKLLILHAKHYGGPPLEAAMYGVPFVGSSDKAGAMIDCPDYIHTPSKNEACNIFDRFMEDHDYYTKIAKSYNKYVVETYSFEAFNNALNNILKLQGVI